MHVLAPWSCAFSGNKSSQYSQGVSVLLETDAFAEAVTFFLRPCLWGLVHAHAVFLVVILLGRAGLVHGVRNV